MPLQSDGGLSRSLVLGPLVSLVATSVFQAPRVDPLLVSAVEASGDQDDQAGPFCPCDCPDIMSEVTIHPGVLRAHLPFM